MKERNNDSENLKNNNDLQSKAFFMLLCHNRKIKKIRNEYWSRKGVPEDIEKKDELKKRTSTPSISPTKPRPDSSCKYITESRPKLNKCQSVNSTINAKHVCLPCFYFHRTPK